MSRALSAQKKASLKVTWSASAYQYGYFFFYFAEA